jgi:hypothetical protein
MNERLATLTLLFCLAMTWPLPAEDLPVATSVTSLDGQWLLAVDPQNVGRQEKWFEKQPVGAAKPAKVPWIIQETFPGYHGVAWYWRDFTAPELPREPARCLLRFWSVDYKADVWLNGLPVGDHEGAETPFVLDVSKAIRPGQRNRLAVRVLNPTHQAIDGIVLNETPHRNKVLPYGPGSAWDQGGIMDSVELLVTPTVRIGDLLVRPDWKTGVIAVQATIDNPTADAAAVRLELTAGPAAAGQTLAVVRLDRSLPPGQSVVQSQLRLDNPRLWDLSDPFLYRVTARISRAESGLFDEQSVRCGFRDFRFADGAFRLNGRRIYLRCSHTGNCCPIGLELPHDPDFLRRDLINAKAMRFNAIRFISGVAKRYQLDLCDEIGLMVYEEPYAAWCMCDSPKFARRYDDSVLGMVVRDRNHASVTMWGLLNETPDGPVFRHALSLLPALRERDGSRMVMLSSGRFDNLGGTVDGIAVGSLSNPGSTVWEDVLSDQHPYQAVPHTAGVLHTLRTIGGNGKPLFLSEYGIGSAVDLLRVVRLYEQAGKADAEDAQFYRQLRDRFLADWQRWKMSEAFDRPEDFFAQSNARMAGQRLLGLNAIRANPNVVGHSLTGTVDQGMTGEGLWTTFRELKPGTADALFDAFAPLRWCLFVEPVNVYRGTPVRLEACLADEDVLRPGQYPVRLQVVGPDAAPVWQQTLTVTIPETKGKSEPPLVLPVFDKPLVIDGPAGKYRFSATFQRGAAAAGEAVEFYVAEPAPPPGFETEVVLWGDDAGLRPWLAEHGIRSRPFSPTAPIGRELILAAASPPAPGGAAAFGQLARRIARGAHVVFLCPAVFAQGNAKTAWLPLAHKGDFAGLPSWLYHKDEWAKRHPIFDGLPAGGLMDYAFYRELIPSAAFVDLDPPAEAVAAGINAACGYSSGLLVAVYPLGAGEFVVNGLQIREHLGRHPAADRLLLNMLRYAAGKTRQPLVELPSDFDAQLKRLKYQD